MLGLMHIFESCLGDLILVSRNDLVDNIDETGCCDRLFGQVFVTCYLYRFGAWLMHLFMVQVEV
jgi:hypothetical protein